MERLIIGGAVIAVVLATILAAYAIGGLIFAALWNWLVPSLWAAFHISAPFPHLSWLAGVAASWLLGILQGFFGGFAAVAKAAAKVGE
jgi:hypothetical protein